MYNCTHQNCKMNEYARQDIQNHQRGGGGHLEFSEIAHQFYDGDGQTHVAKLTDLHVCHKMQICTEPLLVSLFIKICKKVNSGNVLPKL